MRIKKIVFLGNYLFSRHRLKTSLHMDFSNIANELDNSRTFSLLEDIYNSQTKNIFSIYTTGGGSAAINWIFSVPGASRSILQASVPYSKEALNKVLISNDLSASNDKPIDSSFCSSEAALSMSISAFKNAVELYLLETKNFKALNKANLIGVSCSAALISKTIKKGDHRCFVAYTKDDMQVVYSLNLVKGARGRTGEDVAASAMIVEAMAESCGFQYKNNYLLAPETVIKKVYELPDVIDGVRNKEFKMALFVYKNGNFEDGSNAQGNIKPDNFKIYLDVKIPKDSLVYPGSFNPLHEGHIALVKAALDTLKASRSSLQNEEEDEEEASSHPPVVFEISVTNADKAPLLKHEILKRLSQFTELNPLFKAYGISNFCVCITSEPFFIDKSNIFRGSNFIVGADTLSRLINPKYYNNSEALMISALSIMKDRGCKFIVGGRKESTGRFETLSNILSPRQNGINLPDSLKTMFAGIEENDFRFDISSTQLREQIVSCDSNSNSNSNSNSDNSKS